MNRTVNVTKCPPGVAAGTMDWNARKHVSPRRHDGMVERVRPSDDWFTDGDWSSDQLRRAILRKEAIQNRVRR